MTSPKESGAPGTITVGYWLVVTGMAFVVLTVLYLVLNREVLLELNVRANTDPNITRDQLRQSINVLLIVGTVVDVALAALAVFFGNKVRAGVRKGRTRLAIVLLVALFFQLAISNVLGLAALMVPAGGLALLYFRSSSEYLTSAEQAR